MSSYSRKSFVAALSAGASALAVTGCSTPRPENASAAVPASPPPAALDLGALKELAAKRGFAPADIEAALKTFVPLGKHDDYVMLASGGHSGQLVVMGLPSMRILKIVPVFMPDGYAGYGFETASQGYLEDGAVGGKLITHGDTHHPALSETDGDYDGEFAFIHDKVNARVAVIDLSRFETTQIVKNPLSINNHGHSVTPNTEYILETTQYGAPLGWEYAPIEEYRTKYRGLATYWKFDRKSGKIVPEQSFSIELPPYNQDINDNGKLVSHGLSFINSFDAELSYGKDYKKGYPAEFEMSQLAADYMHVIDWKAAEALVRSGRAGKRNGHTLIGMKQAVDHDMLFLIPEPKSPHGVDVSPDGTFLAVAGKLDPHVQIYSTEKIRAAMKKGGLRRDPYGVPIIPLEQTRIAQVQVGLGPLHTQYDGKGYGYTSLYLDSAVAKWKIGDARGNGWEVVDKLPLQYNTGHLAAPHGDTTKPRGEYLVGLNKWSIDRFTPVGPLYPRNLQLVDVAGEKMAHLYDAPIGMAEPHYAQIISASLLKPKQAFAPGFDAQTGAVDRDAPKAGSEGVFDRGDHVLVQMSQTRSHFNPDLVKVRRGQKVVWRLINQESTPNAMHGLALAGYNVSLTLEPGKMTEFSFVADRPGVYPYYCTDFCSALHLEMMGYFLVSEA